LGSEENVARKCRIEEEESAHIPPWIRSADAELEGISFLGLSGEPRVT